MSIRNYHPSDLSTLHQIDQACFPRGIAYSKHEIARFIALRGSRTWVADLAGEAVGFLIARRESHEAAHIVTIDVVEAQRRTGIGRALMEAAESWAAEQGVQILYLETAEDNLVAQRFYRTRGYARVEIVDGYYADGTAAWVMAKRLKAEL